MKITNVAHYVSMAGKEACAENIHFVIEGAKFEALAANGDSLALRHYKNWLKSAEVEKPARNNLYTPCPICGGMVPSGYCASCHEKCYP